MDDWEKFNETTLPEKGEFYSNLNMEDITDGYQIHIKQACRDFDIKKNQVNIMICILKVMHAYFWLIFSKTLEKLV